MLPAIERAPDQTELSTHQDTREYSEETTTDE